MYDRPKLWEGSERIQWACVLMRMVGLESLENLPTILSGLHSVEQTGQTSAFRQAITTARILLSDMETRSAVEGAIYDYFTNAEQRSFLIDVNTLQFKPVYEHGLDSNVAAAEGHLMRPMPVKATNRRMADLSQDLTVQYRKDSALPIRMTGLQFPPVRQHDLSSRPRRQISIMYSELKELAQQLDQEDREAGRSNRGWSESLNPDGLFRVAGEGLIHSDVLDLDGLKHLIGLPGSGKTTLISLLCVLLKRRGQRVAIFFTSVEAARAYLETLRWYGVNAAILMGRSGRTRRTHANRIADLIAQQGGGGFGRSRPGVELLNTSCPLPAFAERWPDDWHIGDAPCEAIREAGSKEPRLCPAWENCGRVKNERELVSADVWLGHVRSLDTPVPAHTSGERIQHFEFLARTFDLIIFDECDEAQTYLDGYGCVTLNLTGGDDNYHQKIQEMVSRVATNSVRVSDEMLSYTLQANEFERHTLRFIGEIRRISGRRRSGRAEVDYADQLLTASFLIRAALSHTGAKQQSSARRLSALSAFWERAMYRAFFFRGVNEKDWPGAEKYAVDLNLSVEDASNRWRDVNQALKAYLALDHAAQADEVIEEIAQQLAPLLGATGVDQIRDHVRLMIVVGFTVASYRRLAGSGRRLARRHEVPDDLISDQASSELRLQVPRSLLGTFSAVRYRRRPEEEGYEIDYLAVDSTPRLLMHRLHELGRASVLLTSATSWLESSPQYHVAKTPDFVLTPRRRSEGEIRLYALPKKHPATGRPLRFSGGGRDREDNLRHMVTALAQPDVAGPSELERAVISVTTTLGKRRMAALIVNSYEQVRLVVEQIHDVNPALGKRTRGVVNTTVHGSSQKKYCLKSEIETVGDGEVDVVIFPISSLGRGINIVFHKGDCDDGKAAVGSVYFLTRPHPAAGDLTLMTSMLARATQTFDSRDFRHLTLSDAQRVYDAERYQVYRRVANLLARPMSASSLDEVTLNNFAANLLVPILQTIGRGTRRSMPVDVYFVDAAWAPRSAEEDDETERSSVLVIMGRVLQSCVEHPDPSQRAVYQALYGVFHDAFQNIIGLNPPKGTTAGPVELFNPSSETVEADFSNFEPEEDAGSTDLYEDAEEYGGEE